MSANRATYQRSGQGILSLAFCVLCALLIFPNIGQAQSQDALSWYQCKLAGDVQNISINGEQASITLAIRIAVFQHGFRAAKVCPFKKGETVTMFNYVSAEEAASLATENRNIDRGFVMGNHDLNTITSGDHLTVIYGYYFEHGNEREVWNFLRIKRG